MWTVSIGTLNRLKKEGNASIHLYQSYGSEPVFLSIVAITQWFDFAPLYPPSEVVWP